MRNFIKYLAFPLFFYFIFFFILTFPSILSFSTKLFADTGDGFQNVWNLWWVNKAVSELHQSIWKTDFLHYPYGTSLIGHTLNPLNGLMAILLLKFLPLIQTYNFILIFSFVAGGFWAFLLIYYLSRSYIASLIGGYIYTFSNFHFAHAQGHLQTVSMEWIPLFILFWILFLNAPKIVFALGSAISLYVNLLSDYYFFFYSLLAALIIYLWQAMERKSISLKYGNKIVFPLIIFILIFAISSGRILTALFLQNRRDPLLGAHPSQMFSTDLLSLFIPGGHSRFAEGTISFWSKLPGNIHESSVNLGISLFFMIVYVWISKKREKIISLWYVIFFLFLFLSFGPKLQIMGTKIEGIIMPYGVLEEVLPFLSLSGMPVRMMVMPVLAGAVIFAFGIKKLMAGSMNAKIISLVMIAVLFIEYLPKEIPVTKVEIPAFVRILKNAENGAVIDLVSDPSESLYFQTVYQKPQAFGYIARVPESVVINDLILGNELKMENYGKLAGYGFKYLITDQKSNKLSDDSLFFTDDKVNLYRLR